VPGDQSSRRGALIQFKLTFFPSAIPFHIFSHIDPSITHSTSHLESRTSKLRLTPTTSILHRPDLCTTNGGFHPPYQHPRFPEEHWQPIFLFFTPNSLYCPLNGKQIPNQSSPDTVIMNSLATPPVPPHFHEHTRLSPSRSSEFFPIPCHLDDTNIHICSVFCQPLEKTESFPFSRPG